MTPSKLGKLISATREAKGLKLRELATLIGKSPSFVSMLENDEEPPKVKEETLVALATELGLDINDLMGLAGKVPEDALPDSGLDVALYRKVKRLPDEKKRELLDEM